MSMESIFDSLLEPTFVINNDQVILYCNETAATVCESTVRKILRKKMRITDLLEFEETIDIFSHLEKITDPSPYKEVRYKSLSGNSGKVQITVQPFISSFEEKCWLVFVRDVTLEERLQKKYRAELEQKEDFILKLEDANKKLENYSKNLEKMVEDRTAEIKKLNELMRALLDSLDQGFFIFDSNGLCLDVYSQACLSTLESPPARKPVWNVLGLEETKIEGFKKWMLASFDEMLPFDDLAPLGPQYYPHSEGKVIQLAYYPLRSSVDQKIEGIVVVSSDITNLVQAQREAEIEKSSAKMILNLIQRKNEILRFMQESEELIQQTETVLSKSKKISSRDHELIFRNLHTLKGGAATYSLHALTEASHQAENFLTQGVAQFESSRNDFEKSFRQVQQHFENFKTKTKEVLGEQIFKSERHHEITDSDFKKILLALESSQRAKYLSAGLKERYLYSNLVEYLTPYNYLTQKSADALQKKVLPLIFDGFDTPLYCQPLQSLCATLVHAYKNAIDHGIESPQERVSHGKPEAGKIHTTLQFNTSELILTISDDGRGIDPLKIRQKLDSRGYNHSQETDSEVIQHVFDSQFSTKDQVTDLSGRGVGMDAIRLAAKSLGGTARVDSIVGKGSTLKISIPLEVVTHITTPKAA